MWFTLHANRPFLVAFLVLLISSVCAGADDADTTDRLGLADLVNYHKALTGTATADDARASDPPMRVVFKDVWHRPEEFRGRRIIVEGRIQRIFRQGPVGDFPSLAEIWIASAVGDPFCLVIPQKTVAGSVSPDNGGPGATAAPDELPRHGQMVRFTGTFLKMVRYTAQDGDRLAPLVVGNQPPLYVRDGSKATSSNLRPANGNSSNGSVWAGSWSFVLILTLFVTGTLVIRRLRLAFQQIKRRDQHRRAAASLGADPPLEFVEVHAKP